MEAEQTLSKSQYSKRRMKSNEEGMNQTTTKLVFCPPFWVGVRIWECYCAFLFKGCKCVCVCRVHRREDEDLIQRRKNTETSPFFSQKCPCNLKTSTIKRFLYIIFFIFSSLLTSLKIRPWSSSFVPPEKDGEKV